MSPLTNYLAFADPESSRSRIGHLDWDNSTVQPLSFSSGRYLDNLYQVIQLNENQIIPAGDTIPLSSVKILPPIAGRDILAVGKNYTEHAAEFHKSGYDSSDKVALPSHPVLFTKRATSIIAHGHPIELHHQFTKTLDYEGEVGVIIGKGGFGIKAENAMDHVWGYTIINDVTARERQRDHKQFFIGKSGDTYCPIVSISAANSFSFE
jgi:2-keto-4-pentenoate hydratase/2-oxohepta-3-ene-1,7-dioic acid hydratase in catechol pathway